MSCFPKNSLRSIALCVCFVGLVSAEDARWFTKQTQWHGHDQFHFKVAERNAYVVVPEQAAPGNPWVWRARFPGYHAEMDLKLVERGYHIGYVDVAGLFGSPKAIKIGNAFYELMTTQRQLSARPALEGVSRGGLFVYNWAAANLDKVACIYCDTPVCDFKSWPGGHGSGLGSNPTWEQCLKAFGLNEESAKTYAGNPIDHAEKLADAGIPLLHIVSENDRVVPPSENTYVLRNRLAKLGYPLEVISVEQGTEKSNGHHFEHPAIEQVVDFIDTHSGRWDLLRSAKRVVFLGDSITYGGHYVALFENWLLHQDMENTRQIINVGLSSETVSGLSEEGHAGGRFPRPDLAERLDRVLTLTKPDLVFACYGINCGIYQPFDEERFAAYQVGIKRLKAKVEAADGSIVFVTPPTFDDQRARKDFSYNGVLDRYADWLVQQREHGWRVIPLHRAMSKALAKRREQDAEFTFQPDSVHPNKSGHEFIASEIVRWFGGDLAKPASQPELKKLVEERMKLLRDAYLTTAGHLRPGVRKGWPIEEAKQKARQLSAQIKVARDTLGP